MTPVQSPQHQLPLRFFEGRVADFDLFAVGGNGEAVEAVRSAAERGQANAIYLWGGAGTGKTHLLQAACQRATELNRRAVLLACKELVGLSAAMLDGMENVDLVAVDDVHAISGQPVWEEAFFGLYNGCRERSCSLLLAARAMPCDLGLSLKDLESRFGWGLVFQLRMLDDDGKLEAIRGRAAARGFDVPTAVGRYLLERLPRNMTVLMSVLDRLEEMMHARRRRMTIPLVRELLADVNGWINDERYTDRDGG